MELLFSLSYIIYDIFHCLTILFFVLVQKSPPEASQISNRDDEGLISRLDDLPETDAPGPSSLRNNNRDLNSIQNKSEKNETSFGIEGAAGTSKRR